MPNKWSIGVVLWINEMNALGMSGMYEWIWTELLHDWISCSRVFEPFLFLGTTKKSVSYKLEIKLKLETGKVGNLTDCHEYFGTHLFLKRSLCIKEVGRIYI